MKNHSIIGREREQQILKNICDEREARLVAIYGRRRVGKTYLVKNFFKEDFDFFFTGSFETPAKIQLTLFQNALNQQTGTDVRTPKSWFEAFDRLKSYLISLKKEKIVVFLDELPWMETPKSNFLTAFSYFWNSWASTRNGLKLIVCGSATSWMLDRIIGDKGGLYGRSSRSVYLAPFNLHETELFLKEQKGIIWNRYQILESYMIFGGIPYYLDMLEKGVPFDVNIDNLFFREGAPLRMEYEFLFRSLFRNSAIYRVVVETLAKKNKGLTQKELKAAMRSYDSGRLSVVLNNLDKCDFIRKYTVFGKKENGCVYQLTDLYSLFYLKFINKKNGLDEHFWSNMKESSHSAWAGYAFEQVCLHHIEQIRGKLSIKGVLTNVCTWSSQKHVDSNGTQWPGCQIDLLICRADHVIDICEMKYCLSDFTVTKDYDDHIRKRTETFLHLTKTRDAVNHVLVTTYGLKENAYSGRFSSVVTMDDLM